MGNLLFFISLIAMIFACYNYFLVLKGNSIKLKVARNSFYISAFSILISSFLLMYFILSHQYQYKYVMEYSGNNLSIGLLMSSFYAGQEGSFLLWLLLMMPIGIVLIKKLKSNMPQESSFMISFSLIAIFLNVLLLPGLKNPFETIWTNGNYLPVAYFNSSILKLQNFQHFIFSNSQNPGDFVKIGPELLNALKLNGIPITQFIIDGKGLNPLLQNFWMQIHPPLLFIGFAMCGVPYSFALSALIRNEYKSWVTRSLPWLAISMTLLGLAIMIGGYWAYGVLGWGGYWGWDPVENSSLVPWIIGIALIHTLLIQKNWMKGKDIGKYVKTNLTLSMLTFVFVIYSTFLTRSGILSDASVHSFAEPGKATYLVLVVFISSLIFLGIYFLKKRWSSINFKVTESRIKFNRENGLFFGAMFLIAIAIIITTGTSAPIFGVTVKTSFYNLMSLPFVILAVLLIPITLIINWSGNKLKNLFKLLLPQLIISLVLTIAIYVLLNIRNPFFILLVLVCLLTLSMSISKIIEYLKYEPKLIGGPLAHIGLSVFILGVLLNALFKTSTDIDLEYKKATIVDNFIYTYTGYQQIEGTNKFKFNVKVSKGETEMNAFPVMYNSSYNGNIMKEPDIITGLYQDHYISAVSYTEGSRKSKYKPNVVDLHRGENWEKDNVKLIFKDLVYTKQDMANMIKGENFKLGAKFIFSSRKHKEGFTLYMKTDNGHTAYSSQVFKESKLKIQLIKIDGSGSVQIDITDQNSSPKVQNAMLSGILAITAKREPFINLVWLGTLLMGIGLIIAWNYRKSRTN